MIRGKHGRKTLLARDNDEFSFVFENIFPDSLFYMIADMVSECSAKHKQCCNGRIVYFTFQSMH